MAVTVLTDTLTTGGDDNLPSPAAPVLALPLRLDGSQLATLPGGSSVELAQSVRLLLSARVGERLASPSYGSPDFTFMHDIDERDVADVIEQGEPRADVAVTVEHSVDRSELDITVHVRPEEA